MLLTTCIFLGSLTLVNDEQPVNTLCPKNTSFSGKVIDNLPFKQTKDKAVVDIDALNSGIYLLDVTTKVGHSRVKVIIQK